MTDADPAVIQREKDALKHAFNERRIKNAFTYRSLSHDTELLIDDLYRDMPANPAGLSLGVVASDFVVDCYYERGALEPLVKAYGSQPYRVASTFNRVLQHLQGAQRVESGRHDVAPLQCDLLHGAPHPARADEREFQRTGRRRHGGATGEGNLERKGCFVLRVLATTPDH